MPAQKKTKQKHVVFDVVGTLVSDDEFHTRITNIIGLKLIAQYITPKLFAHSWRTDAELKLTLLSTSGRNTTFLEERDAWVQGYFDLSLRPEVAEAILASRDAGSKGWCFSVNKSGTQGCFERANIIAPTIIGHDVISVTKPASKAHEALKRIREGAEIWYVSANHWDVSAAVKCGFKGALCTEYEGEALWDLFGHDTIVVRPSLQEIAKKIIVC